MDCIGESVIAKSMLILQAPSGKPAVRWIHLIRLETGDSQVYGTNCIRYSTFTERLLGLRYVVLLVRVTTSSTYPIGFFRTLDAHYGSLVRVIPGTKLQ